MPIVAATDTLRPQGPIDVAAAQGKPATNQLPNSAVAQPAVVVSLSSEATAATQAKPALPVLDPNAVDNALARVGGANGLADIAARIDWSVVAKKFGKAVTDKDKSGLEGAISGTVSYALSSTTGLGIPIKSSVSPEAIKPGVTTNPFTVDDFSFTSGGSTYSVTHGKNGTLLGTKDGQAWKTWQLDDPSSTTDAATSASSGAAVALQTLTSLNTEKPAADKPRAGVDISA